MSILNYLILTFMFHGTLLISVSVYFIILTFKLEPYEVAISPDLESRLDRTLEALGLHFVFRPVSDRIFVKYIQ